MGNRRSSLSPWIFDLDNDVDLDDFVILKTNFGTAALPEPTALIFLALGGLAGARRRRP